MAIDFHDEKNRGAYASREAQPDWEEAIRQIVDPTGKRVVDIGCGGGIYTAAWARLGAQHVTGVDFSARMVRDAIRKNQGRANVSVRQGDALDTGLPSASADIVFERALIHHLSDRAAGFREASRVLSAGGLTIVQDRTPEDVALAGAPGHIRGYFFEAFPRLLAVEAGRRPAGDEIERELREAGFVDVRTASVWETRKRHPDADALAADLRGRTGRSILHELSDGELERLIGFVIAKLPSRGAILEKDRWTIWTARKGSREG